MAATCSRAGTAPSTPCCKAKEDATSLPSCCAGDGIKSQPCCGGNMLSVSISWTRIAMVATAATAIALIGLALATDDKVQAPARFRFPAGTGTRLVAAPVVAAISTKSCCRGGCCGGAS